MKQTSNQFLIALFLLLEICFGSGCSISLPESNEPSPGRASYWNASTGTVTTAATTKTTTQSNSSGGGISPQPQVVSENHIIGRWKVSSYHSFRGENRPTDPHRLLQEKIESNELEVILNINENKTGNILIKIPESDQTPTCSSQAPLGVIYCCERMRRVFFSRLLSQNAQPIGAEQDCIQNKIGISANEIVNILLGPVPVANRANLSPTTQDITRTYHFIKPDLTRINLIGPYEDLDEEERNFNTHIRLELSQ